jgi:hypothetical protein
MTRHLNISPLTGKTMHTLLRLEAPATATEGLDAETFRGFQLAGNFFS